jgi:hypothetical protein
MIFPAPKCGGFRHSRGGEYHFGYGHNWGGCRFGGHGGRSYGGGHGGSYGSGSYSQGTAALTSARTVKAAKAKPKAAVAKPTRPLTQFQPPSADRLKETWVTMIKP